MSTPPRPRRLILEPPQIDKSRNKLKHFNPNDDDQDDEKKPTLIQRLWKIPRDEKNPYTLIDYSSDVDFNPFAKKVLGRGTYGTVYSITSEPAGLKYALKILDKHPPEKQELKVWEQITQRCPNIVPLYEAWNVNGNRHYAMMQCNFTLTNFLEDVDSFFNSRLTNEEIKLSHKDVNDDANIEDDDDANTDDNLTEELINDIIYKFDRLLPDISRALACLHANKIYYRDFRTDNILWCDVNETGSQGGWYLADFSISVSVNDEDVKDVDINELKEPKLLKEFVGPEVIVTGYNPASDIYAFGILIQNKVLPIVKQVISLDPNYYKIIKQMTNLDYRLRPTAEELI